MAQKVHLAIDFGAGSGRVMAGWRQADGSFAIEELHRFGNRPARLGKHVYWDFPALFEEMIEGLRRAVAKGFEIASVGVDTWGVDFGLIDNAGSIVGLPFCYRDESTVGYPERLAKARGAEAHYAEAGIQVMPINTVYRLMSINDEQPRLLEAADRLLFMPDLFSFFLTGQPNVEYTIASTSELIDARTRQWNLPLIESLGLPTRLFGPIVMPGTVRGHLTDSVKKRIGLDASVDVPVVAVGSHDTASAIHASQADASTAFLSSGTWSLLGAVVDEPILTEDARVGDFTNEGAVGGKIKFLQNITGLWILQRLMAAWKENEPELGYAAIIDEGEAAALVATIDVDDPAFSNPESMERAIVDYCHTHGTPAPATRGEFVRCVLTSLAQRYKRGVDTLNALLPSPIRRINIIGGGSQNRLLNTLAAEATGLEIVAGPVEATAIGNIKLQAEALGLD